jgi:hypothetical protein
MKSRNRYARLSGIDRGGDDGLRVVGDLAGNIVLRQAFGAAR